MAMLSCSASLSSSKGGRLAEGVPVGIRHHGPDPNHYTRKATNLGLLLSPEGGSLGRPWSSDRTVLFCHRQGTCGPAILRNGRAQGRPPAAASSPAFLRLWSAGHVTHGVPALVGDSYFGASGSGTTVV